MKTPKPNLRRIEGLIKLIPTLKFDGQESDADPSINKKRFSMDTYFHYCGTPACMAGHVIAKYGDLVKIRRKYRSGRTSYNTEAALLLGLDPWWTGNLFAPNTINVQLSEIKPKQAVAALTRVVKAIRDGKDYTDLMEEQLWGKKLTY